MLRWWITLAKFNVYLVATASTVVEVEAYDGEEAIEKAFDSRLPYASAFDGFDLGDWTLPSEMFPQWSKPEEDCEQIDE
jgi:hypothetical protein